MATSSTEALQGEIALTRKGRLDESILISELMNDEDFLPILISGLQRGSSSEVRLHVMSILQEVLEKGTETEKNAVISSDIIPALISLFRTRESNGLVLGQALLIFSTCDDILRALTQLVATTQNVEWLRSVSHILTKITGASVDEFPASSSLSELLRLLARLLRKSENDVERATNVVLTLTQVVQKGGGFPAVLASGILPSVIDLLADEDEELHSTVILFIAEIAKCAGSSHVKICEFFEALKGSSGLKYYKNFIEINSRWYRVHNCWLLDDKYRRGCELFFSCVEEALRGPLRLRMTNAVMASGLDHALLQFLSPEEDTTCLFYALDVVLPLASVMDEEVALKPLLNVLKWSYSRSSDFDYAIVDCLQILIQYNPKVWDELIRLGGLKQMIRGMKENDEPEMAVQLLQLLKEMLRAKPEGGLEPSKKVAKCLNLVVRNLAKFKKKKPESFPQLLSDLLDCLDKVAEYGESGRELIKGSGSLQAIITALSEADAGVQEKALDVLGSVCAEEGGCRQAALNMGVINSLHPLLQSQLVEVKTGAVGCVILFVRGKLTSSQASKVLQMIDLLRDELEQRRAEGEEEELIQAMFWSRVDELQRKQRKWWRKLI